MKAVVALPLPSTMVDPRGSPSFLTNSAALRLRGEGASLRSPWKIPAAGSRKGAAPVPTRGGSQPLFSSPCSEVGEFQLLVPQLLLWERDASAAQGAVPERLTRFFLFLGRGGAAHKHTQGASGEVTRRV